MADEKKPLPADWDGDRQVSEEEKKMYLEFKRKRLEDEDAMRDAQRNMAWFALYGMLLYPCAVVASTFFGLESGASVLGDMAPTYFVSVAAIVAAFYGKSALEKKE